MRAVYYEAFSQAPEMRIVPDPEPSSGGVVVRVVATGLCRSDWHGWMGHDDDIRLPHVPGHEFAGEIVALGAGVRGWRIGDRVTAPFCLGCGSCPTCRNGDPQICDRYQQPGFTYWGSFAEYVAVPYAAANLVRLPDSITFAQAALLGCRFTTAYRAVVQQGRLRAGEWVVVYGCGGVGLSALMIARAFGARTIGIDIHPEKLDFARRAGAEHTLHAARTDDLPAAVRELSRGGAHLSLDALGSPETCLHSLLSLRKRGRHVQVGLLAGHRDPPLPMGQVIARELEIIGSHGLAAQRFPDLLGMIEPGQIDPARLLGSTIPLEEAPRALASMGQFPGVGATLIQVV